MNTKALRQKILDLAIHGKLVPQNPKDESATVLLEKIRAEKAEKIKQGELKADKKDSFIFVGSDKHHYEQFADGTVKDIEDEIPFDVPEGWAWCRLGEIANIARGGSPRPIQDYITNAENGINWIKIGDTAENSKYISSAKEKIKPEGIKHSRFVHSGDFLLTNSMSFGRPYILKIDGCIHDGWLVFANIKECLNQDYLYYILSSKYIYETFSHIAVGSTVKNLKSDTVKQVLFPLPSISEQNRIVESVDKIFTIIKSIEQNKSILQDSIKQAKSKILDLAIHGKLVPQDPNDEPAEELLKRIATSDNRPYEKMEEVGFEIPESWQWVTIKNIVNYIGDGDWIESKDQSDKGIRLIQTGNIGFGTFKDKEGKYHYITENTFNSLGCNEIFEGDILISRLPEPVGRACILPQLPERTITAVDCTIIRLNEEVLIKDLFVYYTISNKYLELIKENCTGTTRLRISRSNLEKILIPIPPLSEQKRIIKKIDELFSLLDDIQNNLI